MGLAFTAVADDPTAVFYNPAGIGWLSHYEVSIGASVVTRSTGDFQGSNPYPGPVTEHIQKQAFLLPTVYAVAPLTKELHFGFGVFVPYGLGFRWENAEVLTGTPGSSPVSSTSFSGRFISQNAFIQSIDLNPVVSYRLLPEVTIAAGADVRFSKVTLERNQAAINPFTNSVADIAHVKLDSDLTDNHGWGWNAGILVKPVAMLSFGVSYRSRITVDYSGNAKFTQRPTGYAQFDALVAAQLPPDQKVTTSITYPSMLNIGIAVRPMPALTVSLEGGWTEWSTIKSLDIIFASTPSLNLHRPDLWKNTWAYRSGLEYKVTGKFAVRAGYLYDKTPQPAFDAGPILADSTRDVYTAGFGYNTEKWGVDIGDCYIRFRDRDTTGVSQDNFYGVYKQAANVISANLRVSF